MPSESTSRDAVELTRSLYAAANSRDLDAIMGFVGPACVADISRWQLGTHEGREAIRQFAAQWFDLYEYWVHVEQLRDFGEGVVCVGHVARHVHAPHNYLQWSSAIVLVWADGMLAQVTVCPEFEEARAAAERLVHELG